MHRQTSARHQLLQCSATLQAFEVPFAPSGGRRRRVLFLVHQHPWPEVSCRLDHTALMGHKALFDVCGVADVIAAVATARQNVHPCLSVGLRHVGWDSTDLPDVSGRSNRAELTARTHRHANKASEMASTNGGEGNEPPAMIDPVTAAKRTSSGRSGHREGAATLGGSRPHPPRTPPRSWAGECRGRGQVPCSWFLVPPGVAGSGGTR